MLKPLLVTEAAKVTLSYPDFSIAYPNLKFDKLEMDFNPLIEHFNLQGNFCLLHWQAKPFGERRWGIYDSGADRYTSVKYSEVELRSIPQLLQVDEKKVTTVPTAVLYFPDCKIIQNGYYSLIPA
jgi:hypothetical protein